MARLYGRAGRLTAIWCPAMADTDKHNDPEVQLDRDTRYTPEMKRHEVCRWPISMYRFRTHILTPPPPPARPSGPCACLAAADRRGGRRDPQGPGPRVPRAKPPGDDPCCGRQAGAVRVPCGRLRCFHQLPRHSAVRWRAQARLHGSARRAAAGTRRLGLRPWARAQRLPLPPSCRAERPGRVGDPTHTCAPPAPTCRRAQVLPGVGAGPGPHCCNSLLPPKAN
jgi:hypothetical protein